MADADATRMSAQAQAEALQMMERANAIVTAARASVLSAFTSGQGYSAGPHHRHGGRMAQPGTGRGRGLLSPTGPAQILAAAAVLAVTGPGQGRGHGRDGRARLIVG